MGDALSPGSCSLPRVGLEAEPRPSRRRPGGTSLRVWLGNGRSALL